MKHAPMHVKPHAPLHVSLNYFILQHNYKVTL